jgi:hypothetical protein
MWNESVVTSIGAASEPGLNSAVICVASFVQESLGGEITSRMRQ